MPSCLCNCGANDHVIAGDHSNSDVRCARLRQPPIMEGTAIVRRHEAEAEIPAAQLVGGRGSCGRANRLLELVADR